MAIHVHDFLIFYNNENEKIAQKRNLLSKFSIKESRNAKFFLGLNIEKTPSIVKIKKKIFYYWSVKDTFNMNYTKRLSPPMEVNFKLNNEKIEI